MYETNYFFSYRNDRKLGANITSTSNKSLHHLRNGWCTKLDYKENINILNLPPSPIFKVDKNNKTSNFKKISSNGTNVTFINDYTDIAAEALIELHNTYVDHQPQGEDLLCDDLDQYQTDSLRLDAYTDDQSDPSECQNDSSTDYPVDNVSENQVPSMKSSEMSDIPKKRWLQQWDSARDLAQPINWSDEMPSIVEVENQKRPTVLVRVENGKEREVSKTDMQVAMALVELYNSAPSAGYSY